jgi:hypothetical protein
MRQAAGTSLNPQSVQTPMLMLTAGRFMVMVHAQAFLNNVNASGPRGGQETFSTNWVMASATRARSKSAISFRTMLSLEPATIGSRRYPEPFQTGETAFGKQLIDGQHPHDFVMELAAEYIRRVGTSNVYLYAAPVGDPAIGPVAFPHRASAFELPQAPLTHHFIDSTHISFNVVTAGINRGWFTLEASAFHGREPDEKRWTIEGGRIDSWAARMRLQPTQNLDLQISSARLTHPEFVEPGFQRRATASISYSRGSWSSTAAWGRVYKEVHDRNLAGFLAETAFHGFTARVEVAEKDELFPHAILKIVPRPPQSVRVFRVRAFTTGYSVDVLKSALGTVSLGANATRYQFPAVLNGFYGEHPHTVYAFLRMRLGAPMRM